MRCITGLHRLTGNTLSVTSQLTDVRDRVDAWSAAFAGADAVFWLGPPVPRAESVEAAYVGFTRPAAEAFKRHSVRRVIGIWALGRSTPWAAHAGYEGGQMTPAAAERNRSAFRAWLGGPWLHAAEAKAQSAPGPAGGPDRAPPKGKTTRAPRPGPRATTRAPRPF